MDSGEDEIQELESQAGCEDEIQEMESQDADADKNQNNYNLKRKRTNQAPVWNCAEKTETGAKCSFCEKTWVIKDGSTSNVLRHLETCHREEENVKKMISDYDNMRKQKKQKREKERKEAAPKLTSFGFTRKEGIDSKLKDNIDKSIIKYLISSHRPFSDVNVPEFREMIFTANPGYLCLDRKTARRKFDKMADEVKDKLSKEIVADVSSRELKIISVISDHGTSQDTLRTKKNVVVVTWTSSNFELKIDTLGLIPSHGSQTSLQIKQDICNLLKTELDLDGSWRINWVTDGAANVVKARNPISYPSVGLHISHHGSCVDHTFELACEDSLKAEDQVPLRTAIQKMKQFVNHINKSSLSRQKLSKCCEAAGHSAKTTIKGTSNRFFSKFFEADRFLQLIEPINTFIENESEDESVHVDFIDVFSDEEVHLLETYRDSLQLVVKSSEILEGEKYVTSSSVIPFLDGIHEELQKMKSRTDGHGKSFISR